MEGNLLMLKRRIVALESKTTKEVSVEEFLRVLIDKKKGIPVSEEEWQRVKVSSIYKFIEAHSGKDKLNS